MEVIFYYFIAFVIVIAAALQLLEGFGMIYDLLSSGQAVH